VADLKAGSVEGLHQAAKTCQQFATDMIAAGNKLNTVNQELQWNGQASATFKNVMDTWHQNYSNTVSHLDVMGGMLNHAAMLQEQTEGDNTGAAGSIPAG